MPGSPEPFAGAHKRTKGSRIRVGGTLLALFREKAGLSQQKLAEELGVNRDSVSHCEEGSSPSLNLIQPKIGLIAEALHLNGHQIKDLRGAADADDFIWDVLKPQYMDRLPREQCRDFRLTVTVPASEMRHWLRVVFWDNCISREQRMQHENDELDNEEVPPPEARLLVEPGALRELRERIRAIHELAEEAEVPLDQRLHLLLFLARSMRTEELDRIQAVQLLEQAIKRPRLSLLSRRLLAYGLCELGKDSAITAYLVQTEQPGKEHDEDRETSLRFMRRIAADNGRGVETLELLLRINAFHADQRDGALVALDFRTIAQLIASTVPREGGWPTAFSDLQLALRLQKQVRRFQACEDRWVAEHKSRPTISHYADEILEQLNEFGKAVRKRF